MSPLGPLFALYAERNNHLFLPFYFIYLGSIVDDTNNRQKIIDYLSIANSRGL
jgi:hypothetical protein